MEKNQTNSKNNSSNWENVEAPEWLPDWRDFSQYPDPKDAPMNQWQWEFLRRNSNYQEAFKNHNQRLSTEISLKYGCKDTWLFDPSDSRIKIIEGKDSFLRKFEIRTGASAHIGNINRTRKFINREGRKSEHRDMYFDEPERYHSILIDTYRPIKAQLDCMENILETYYQRWKEEKKKYKEPPEQFLKYIRTWDALVSGASETEVGIAIYGIDKKDVSQDGLANEINQYWLKANNLIDWDYRYIDDNE